VFVTSSVWGLESFWGRLSLSFQFSGWLVCGRDAPVEEGVDEDMVNWEVGVKWESRKLLVRVRCSEEFEWEGGPEWVVSGSIESSAKIDSLGVVERLARVVGWAGRKRGDLKVRQVASWVQRESGLLEWFEGWARRVDW